MGGSKRPASTNNYTDRASCSAPLNYKHHRTPPRQSYGIQWINYTVPPPPPPQQQLIPTPKLVRLCKAPMRMCRPRTTAAQGVAIIYIKRLPFLIVQSFQITWMGHCQRFGLAACAISGTFYCLPSRAWTSSLSSSSCSVSLQN